ncbi:MAG: GNAT family N-acetyltransferase [Chloroflexota bacterium]|nr:GNAT family N-acetyltransferase [Chloroflexota bacterium]
MTSDDLPTNDSALDANIQQYLRAVTARGRDIERIGPFQATFSRSSTNPFLNYAIPDDEAAPSAHDVEQLIRAYEGRDLRSRLEYITTCAPRVETPLVAAGFVTEGRLALMTCRSGDERELPAPPDIELIRPQTDEELFDLRMVQHEAYRDPEPPNHGDVEGVAVNLRAGGMAVLARVSETREPVGAAEYTPALQGFSELTSVAVRTRFRRRGIAAAMTAWLLRVAFDAGVAVPFLMADEAEERIYTRAGFRTTSHILHISR